jgi:hypothetical protein
MQQNHGLCFLRHYMPRCRAATERSSACASFRRDATLQNFVPSRTSFRNPAVLLRRMPCCDEVLQQRSIAAIRKQRSRPSSIHFVRPRAVVRSPTSVRNYLSCGTDETMDCGISACYATGMCEIAEPWTLRNKVPRGTKFRRSIIPQFRAVQSPVGSVGMECRIVR